MGADQVAIQMVRRQHAAVTYADVISARVLRATWYQLTEEPEAAATTLGAAFARS